MARICFGNRKLLLWDHVHLLLLLNLLLLILLRLLLLMLLSHPGYARKVFHIRSVTPVAK